MKSKLINRLKNWKPTALEVVIIAGTLVSGVTTGVGAYAYVNHSTPIALAFTLFVQGSMFCIGHYLCEDRDPNNDHRQRRRTFWLLLSWALFAMFSVYFSALGLFQLQHQALKQVQARASLIDQWNHASSEIGKFKTSASTAITQLKQSTVVDLKLEQGRARQARIEHHPYSSETLQRLSAQMTALNSAEAKLRDVKLPSVVPPENSDEARQFLDQAFAGAREAFAVMPEQVRARLAEPQPFSIGEVSDHIQEAFWAELKARSATVLAIVVLALLLDVLPVQLRFAASRRRTVADWLVDVRLWFERLSASIGTPLSSQTEVVQVKVQGMPQLDIHITVPATKGGPLVNAVRDFAQIQSEVRRELRHEVQLDSVTTGSGRPILDNRPLLAQLGDERELILKYVPKLDSYDDPFPEEVN